MTPRFDFVVCVFIKARLTMLRGGLGRDMWNICHVATETYRKSYVLPRALKAAEVDSTHRLLYLVETRRK